MTTPRVTKIPLVLVPVEAESFLEASSRRSAAKLRLGDREARVRQANLVRRVVRLRAARSRKR